MITEFPRVLINAGIADVFEMGNQKGTEVSKTGCPVVQINGSDSNLLVTCLLTGTT